ncbi:hypothetical protein [Zobellia uliginosa]|uniref:hypothetical protein n=1 Tax=Zobellia uliginosa TaxID=143224 RepID=UPI0009710072|nr:hypothetical protein [Zobellia uliginosa]
MSISLYAQSKDSLVTKGTTFHFHVPNFNATNHSLNFKSLSFPKNIPTLSLYNPTTNMYDNYLGDRNGYTYTNSTIFFDNKSNFFIDLFLGNDSFMESNSLMPNHPFIWDEDATYRVRDSFNPYGATNMREALSGGVLSLLFN